MTDDLTQQHQFMDQFSQAWRFDYEQSGGTVFCGKGCCSCCTLAVNCTYGEALLVNRCIDQNQKAAVDRIAETIIHCASAATSLKDWLGQYRQKVGNCPFLDSTGACGVYPARPLSCRSLLSTAVPKWCNTDFSTLDQQEKQQYMDRLDRTVVSFPTHYVATLLDMGKELELVASKRMKALYGFAVSGNLPYLVWLEQHHNLQAVFKSGLKHSLEYLSVRKLLQPFLISFEE
jgi:Fe-S-cluster containining protein